MERGRLLVVGTGAMACLFAARFSAAGIPVVLLGSWRDGVEAIRRDGIRVLEGDGQGTVYRVPVVEDPSALPEMDYALVLVKSWQTERAARNLAGCLAAHGLALTLQNGLGNREILSRELGEDRSAFGVTTIGANLPAPGQVRPAGDGLITLEDHPRLASLASLLKTAGFPVEFSQDTGSLLWGKLVINAAINPLTAILGVPNGELLERPAARSLMADAACEAARVCAAQGIRLPYPDPVRAVEAVARRTAANRSSMLQDVRRGAPTEVDAISGAIVQAGERTGVPAPFNRALWQLVKAMNQGIGDRG